MGCVSSTLLNQDEDFSQIGSNALGHHIVSLTSTTYGLLSLDPPPQTSSPMTPPIPLPRFPSVSSKSLSFDRQPPAEVINSWELMAGLLDSNSPTPDHNHSKDSNSFRFSPHITPPNSKPSTTPKFFPSKQQHLKENSNPNTRTRKPVQLFPDSDCNKVSNNNNNNNNVSCKYNLEQFEYICPPNGENKVVLYTTSLRGIRKTFEGCNAVRAVLQGLGYAYCERDISMDRGFRNELKLLLEPFKKDNEPITPPCLFIKGRYVGGSDDVLKIHEEGGLVELLYGLPRVEAGAVCDGCGGVRFLPCFRCNGSCKLVTVVKEVDHEDEDEDEHKDNDDEYKCKDRTSFSGSVKRTVVVRCPDCNENGLVLCPICS